MKHYNGKIVIATMVGVEERIEMLKRIGMENKNIIIL